jgi:Ser/Thr protein kinase RdoA (MazF antagonist)
MTARQVTKRYTRAEDCRTALGNYRFFADLDTLARLPPLISTGAHTLTFARVPGRHAEPADLIRLAACLGDLHGAAYTTELHAADLGRPFTTRDGLLLPDFAAPRSAVLRRRLENCAVPDPTFGLQDAVRVLQRATAGPAALYKDANPRNFLLAREQVTLVDFDDLTLAPFGYDLAKLLVTLAMTHGRTPDHLNDVVNAYNNAANLHQAGLDRLTLAELLTWAEIHHILTSRYAGTNGYRHGWHTMRPRPAPGPAEPSWPC